MVGWRGDSAGVATRQVSKGTESEEATLVRRRVIVILILETAALLAWLALVAVGLYIILLFHDLWRDKVSLHLVVLSFTVWVGGLGLGMVNLMTTARKKLDGRAKPKP